MEVAVDYYDMYNRLCRNDVFAKSTGVETVCERINRGIQVNDDDEEEEETEEIWLAVATAAVVVVWNAAGRVMPALTTTRRSMKR